MLREISLWQQNFKGNLVAHLSVATKAAKVLLLQLGKFYCSETRDGSMRVYSIQVSYLEDGKLSDCFTKNQKIQMKKANIFLVKDRHLHYQDKKRSSDLQVSKYKKLYVFFTKNLLLSGYYNYSYNNPSITY